MLGLSTSVCAAKIGKQIGKAQCSPVQFLPEDQKINLERPRAFRESHFERHFLKQQNMYRIRTNSYERSKALQNYSKTNPRFARGLL